MMKAAIFDMDGTLIDSVGFHAEAWLRAFQRFGHPEVQFERVRSQIGKGGDELMPVFLSKREVEESGDKIEKWRTDLFRREYLPRVQAFPMVRDLFLRLKQDGYQIALASSSNKKDLEAYKQIANIADLLEANTSADDAERSKPHPDIFQAALQQLGGIEPKEAIVIGDTPYDAEAASKLGIQNIIGVLCGGFAETDLRRAGAREIFRDPAELLSRYDESLLSRQRRAA